VAVPKIKDASSPRRKAGPKERQNPLVSLVQYFKDVRSEFKKVMWPGRAELVSATIVVVVALAFFIVFTGVFDFIFQKIITAVLP